MKTTRPRLLQVNFKHTLSPEELQELAERVAPAFAECPGLLWKLWIQNADARSAGGSYLFDSSESLKAFLDGPLAAELLTNTAFSDFVFKAFDVIESASRLTRAPLPSQEPNTSSWNI